MADPYSNFLGDSNPFTTKEPSQPTISGSSGGLAHSQLAPGNRSFTTAAPANYQDPKAIAAYRQDQNALERSWLYGSPPAQPTLMSPGFGMGGGVNTNSGSVVRSSDASGATVYRRTAPGGASTRDGFGYGGGQGFASSGTPSWTQAGMNDVSETQKKADAQWQRKNQQAQSLSTQLDANRKALGASLEATNKDTRDAESKFLDSIQEFGDRTAQDASSAARGIRQSYQSRMQEASQYTRADGTMKTQAEMDAEKSNLRNEVDAQIQQTLAPIASQYAAATAGMKQQFSSFLQANSQLRAAQQFQAIQYDLQGRNYLYDYISQNPETHVNVLDTLLALSNASGGGGWSTLGPTSSTAPSSGAPQAPRPQSPLRVDPNAGLAGGGTTSRAIAASSRRSPTSSGSGVSKPNDAGSNAPYGSIGGNWYG